MRWIFILLVLANGFYALWQQQSREPAAVEVSAGELPVPTLVLLTEADPEVLEAPPAPVQLAHQAPVPEPVEPSCWFLGVFDDKGAADKAVVVIQSAQLEARLDLVEVRERSDYWVHVGPFSAREKALAVLQELRERGVDSFLIAEGELSNAISLGFFSQKASADRMLERYKSLSYPMGVFEVERFRPSYHLYASGRVDKPELVAMMADRGLVVNPEKKLKKSCI